MLRRLPPWSAERDVGPEFAKHERAGIQEYWILNPQALAQRFYRRGGGGDSGGRSAGLPDGARLA